MGEAQELRCEFIPNVIDVADRYQLAPVLLGLMFRADDQLTLEWMESNFLTGDTLPVVQLIALIQGVAVLHRVAAATRYPDKYQVAAAGILNDTEPYIGDTCEYP